MTKPIRQHYTHDEPDDIGIMPSSARLALLAAFALSLLLWGALWFAMTWTIGVLQG